MTYTIFDRLIERSNLEKEIDAGVTHKGNTLVICNKKITTLNPYESVQKYKKYARIFFYANKTIYYHTGISLNIECGCQISKYGNTQFWAHDCTKCDITSALNKLEKKDLDELRKHSDSKFFLSEIGIII